MQTDFTAQRLLKAFHLASNQASGAWKLFTALSDPARPKPISTADFALATDYCATLDSAAKAAEEAYRRHEAAALLAEGQRIAALAAPITPLDQFNAAAYEAQQRGLSQLAA